MSKIKKPSIFDNKSEGMLKFPQKASSASESSSQPNLVKPRDVVVSLIFDFLLDSIIERHVMMEISNKSENSFERPIGSITRNFKELEMEELLNFDIISINGSNVVLMPKGDLSLSSFKKSRINKPKSGSCTCLYMDKIPGRKSAPSRTSKKNTSRSSFEFEKNQNSSLTLNGSSIYMKHEAYITFTNGNVYEGEVSQRLMDGEGKFIWANGTFYEGQFVNGYPNGKGTITLPELSRYIGQFYKGFFHGDGVFYAYLTPMLYKGSWKYGKFHGKGWLLYEPNNWYDGEWYENIRHGDGERHYRSGAKYKGRWHEGTRCGQGTMIWENNDYYKGEWFNGLMHGYGEYIWKAFLNKTFSFPIQNFYKGHWVDGQRSGLGIMHFGTESGAKLAGFWEHDLKHGEGIMICGNGKFVEGNPLFKYDKPCNIFYSPNSDLLPSDSLENISKEIDLNLTKKRSNSNILENEDGVKCTNNVSRIIEIENKFLELPIFTVTELVDLSYYIDLVLKEYVKVCKCNSKEECNCSFPGATKPKSINLIKNAEEIAVRNLIKIYSPKLSAIYNKYASITVQEKLNFKPVMIRLFLWQFYRDIEITKEGFTLVHIDTILAHNQFSGIDRNSNPFETIYFWQFFMSLTGTALLINSKKRYVQRLIPEGTLAMILSKFLNEIVFSTTFKHKGLALFECKDLLPIQKVYTLYKSLGNPLTVKHFLRYTCVKRKEKSLCHLSNLFNEQCNITGGINSVPIGTNIAFFKLHSIGERPDNVITTPKSYNLIVLRKLGAKKVIHCLVDICPLISSNGILINIDYPLNFLEFYETLLSCTYLLVKQKLKKEMELMQKPVTNHLLLGTDRLTDEDTLRENQKKSKAELAVDSTVNSNAGKKIKNKRKSK